MKRRLIVLTLVLILIPLMERPGNMLMAAVHFFVIYNIVVNGMRVATTGHSL